MTDQNQKAMWSCMIGEIDRSALPHGSDAPMRSAVAEAYREITGTEDVFIFSGWGDRLDEAHRAVVENREPDHYKIRDDLADRLGQCEQFIAHLGSDVEDLPTAIEQFEPDAVAEGLLLALRELGDEYGPLGVALVAASLSDEDAVVARLSSRRTEPLLGLATTAHLLSELECRMRLTYDDERTGDVEQLETDCKQAQKHLPASVLAYSTAGPPVSLDSGGTDPGAPGPA